ncbi:MAG TPA: histidine kinase dimerization/phosphoacceptor domain -containing protein, partial [Oculatellaceae cyanobacterium]
VMDTAGKSIYVNQVGLQLHSIEAPPEASLEKLSEAYQVYRAGTDQLYSTEELPLVRALRGEKVTLDDLEIHQPDKIVPLEVLGTPIYDEQGNIVYALAAFQDITSRKQAEAERQEFIEALKQTNEQLQAVLDTVPGFVSWMNSDGHYLGVNRRLADAFHLSSDAFVGREVGFFLSNAQCGQFIHQFLASPAQTASQVIDVPINGMTRHYLVTAQKYCQDTSAVSVAIDITERMLAEQALRTSLREKEVLLQEVHHRVKNNLQIICSLLDLQAQNLTDQKTLDVFQESFNRVKSMALIHEKLYQSTSLETIDFAEYIETLIYYLFQSYRVNSDLIKVKVNIEPICLNIDTAIPCGLIINELLSNSLKYAFPKGKGGLIEINFKSDNAERFILNVKDDGIGFPKDFNLHKVHTLGLNLVKILTQQLDGDIELDQTQGVEFKMQFSELSSVRA